MGSRTPLQHLRETLPQANMKGFTPPDALADLRQGFPHGSGSEGLHSALQGDQGLLQLLQGSLVRLCPTQKLPRVRRSKRNISLELTRAAPPALHLQDTQRSLTRPRRDAGYGTAGRVLPTPTLAVTSLHSSSLCCVRAVRRPRPRRRRSQRLHRAPGSPPFPTAQPRIGHPALSSSIRVAALRKSAISSFAEGQSQMRTSVLASGEPQETAAAASRGLPSYLSPLLSGAPLGGRGCACGALRKLGLQRRQQLAQFLVTLSVASLSRFAPGRQLPPLKLADKPQHPPLQAGTSAGTPVWSEPGPPARLFPPSVGPGRRRGAPGSPVRTGRTGGAAGRRGARCEPGSRLPELPEPAGSASAPLHSPQIPREHLRKWLQRYGES